MSNLKEIKSALAGLLAQVEQMEQNQPTALILAESEIKLAPGERYAGILLDDAGKPSHHLILLPGDVEATWDKAHELAADAGGDLPTRREQSLLFANLKSEFQTAYYWSGEQYSEGYAWNQYFDNGYQDGSIKSYERRVRFVRRLTLQSFGTSAA